VTSHSPHASHPAAHAARRGGPTRLAVAALALTAGVLAALTAPAEAQPHAGDAGEPDARAKLHQTLHAHGGLDRFRAFGALRYHTAGLPYSAAAPLDFDHVADLVARRHRMDGRSARGTFAAAATDRGGWTTDPEALGVPARWVTHGNSYFVMMPFVFADPAARVTDLGTRVYDGQAFDALGISYAKDAGDTPDDDYVLYIDRATRRLRLIDFTVTYGPMRGDAPIDRVPRRSLEFVAWQEVDGLLIPHRLHYAGWERTADGGRRAEAGAAYTVTDAGFARTRPDATLFDAPAGAVRE